MKKFMLSFLLSTIISAAMAQNDPLWMRYPSISPDGTTIVFSYKGDLYKVPSVGGNAQLLTIHEAHDYYPVWSKDGKQIAFASDRYGNFDVFVIPAEGGTAKRLTYHSTNDYPWDFTPDNKSVIFGSGRNDMNTSVRFPRGNLFSKLYSVPVTGGRSIMQMSAGSEFVHYNTKGDLLVFQDRKGTEDAWRKHHTSSVTRDIWTYQLTNKEYKKITSFEGEDREPVFSADGQFVYYLSEKSGNQNIFKLSLSNKAAEQKISNFKDNPVRHLSIANNNTLCFTQNGEIYTIQGDGNPKKITVKINSDARQNDEKNVTLNSGATEMSLSPNGKEIAFVFRGEVFISSVEGGITKRITNTPQQERMVAFGKDGKSIYYAAERGESWDIMKTSIVRKEEPYFYASTLLKEEAIIASEKEEFQPVISPDGKEIAYLEERNVLKIFNLEKKLSRTIIPSGQIFSYRDGDQQYEFSPDGKWIAARSNKGRYGASEVMLFKADGTDQTGIDLTKSGFAEGNIRWGLNGKMILWTSGKEGKGPLAYQGARETDIFALFLDKAALDQFRLNKSDYSLFKEKEDKEKKDSSKQKENWNPDFTNLDNQKIKLTNGSANINDYILSNDGSKLYYMARYESGSDLWVIDTRTRELKSLAKLGAAGGGLELSKDGKSIFVLADGRISKVDIEAGRVSPVNFNGEMVLNTAGERAYIMEHAWRQVKKKFYDPNIHGINWEMYRKNYERFLPHINNNYDFQELLSELLGELNASHTGGRYSPQNPNGDATASLGLFYDETLGGSGLLVTEVMQGGPLDNANSKIKAGTIIEKIDGEPITDQIDWAILLNRKAGKSVLLTAYQKGSSERFEEIVKPIALAGETALLYKRWINHMDKMVNELSSGKVGYVHVQAMNDGSFRDVYEIVMGKNADKEALIVDTRFNGGGWLHDDLVTFLNGKSYLTFAPYGFKAKGNEPQNKWSKPSCVVMSESNYSDAFIFPYAYKQIGIGKLIGKPVPGTGTAVWWETQIDPTIVFGIPMIATIGAEGRPTENLQVNPDIDVATPYHEILFGKDAQIETAVKEMLKLIKK